MGTTPNPPPQKKDSIIAMGFQFLDLEAGLGLGCLAFNLKPSTLRFSIWTYGLEL